MKGKNAQFLTRLDTVQQEGVQHLQGQQISRCNAQHEGLRAPGICIAAALVHSTCRH